MLTLEAIKQSDMELSERYADKLIVNRHLDRTLVSFQANKRQNGYRWFKYKEGFSADLITYILRSVGVESGQLLDPFAGSGAALFVAAKSGINTLGIELLPVGCEIIKARKIALTEDSNEISTCIDYWLKKKPWKRKAARALPFSHLRITDGAFPPETAMELASYLAACTEWPHEPARTILRFAAMCVLEEVSFTRKDGQYLRWDHRSGRRQGTKIFNKGTIQTFPSAIERKLTQIRDDLYNKPVDLFSECGPMGEIKILAGSCLNHLPTLESSCFDCLITSPPYCNRYDYTRTYALELAFLGINELQLKGLRQTMVSCTVENREKHNLEPIFGKETLDRAKTILASQKLLNQVLDYLEGRKEAKLLNNTGIPRMVRNYFWEMTLVLAECARVLRPGAPLVMVNDNVRYEGAGVPVDLVLSDIATQLGFEVDKIWVLPIGKGNSSQQMGKHGRDELRKCVYIWRAPTAKRARWQRPQPVLEQ